MRHCKPTLLALALGLTLGGCALPGPVKKIFDPASQPGAEEQLRAAETALRRKPDDVERRKNVVVKSAALAEEALRTAKARMDTGDDAAALAEVSRLLALAPEHMRAQQLKRQLERRLRLKLELDAAAEIGAQRPREALERLGRILQEQPDYPQAQALRDELQNQEAGRRDARPSLAEALRQPVTLNFKIQPISSIFDAISQLAGIDFVFDPEVPIAAPASIVASQTTAEDAINLLLRTHQLEKKVLSQHSMLIYSARSEKAKEYQELLTRAFYLSQANASHVLAALRQISSPKNVHLDERTNAVIVRDTPEVMAVIERLVASLDIAQSEVTMDVQVLEVNTNDVLDVGVDYPTELRFSVLPKEGSDKVTVGDLLGLNRDGIGVGGSNGGDLGAAIKLLQRQGKTKVLANPKIRVRNMEKASIKIGEKVPVVTTTNANGVVTESVNYQDVGLILQVEPRISLSNEVSVKVNMEVSNLKGEVKTAGGGTVYPMSTRNAETVMTARDGETQVLAGLIKQQYDRGSSGLPGLSTLGWLGSLFGSQKRSAENTELILLLTPRIERALDLPAASNSYFHSGTEGRMTLERLTTEAARPVVPANAAAPALDSPLAAP
ncbi:hypothetical protein JD974_08925 [Chromobacterium haemolyticum]|uniref:Secretin n=1 Tax=Chromobacterium haemolyticum TaxID=394935 RepID=A0ABS3GLM7_9NEIS|nr:secretin N-terminal domain-containing protein [Chromobacterium haemolyticum]MBK0414527.1 hypothetical protein [Chromobacterium haemolyticum]MBO0415839.1 hypothetical protein [Chromobacterium haemolyticum]MBO0499099.1 hypothetical protein [Chromobacterium haemolyticum]